MIFALDVGNTNIKCGIFENSKLIHSFRIATNIESTSDEFGIKILSFFEYLDLDKNDVEGIIISSVIPSINYTLEHMIKMYFGVKPIFVGPGIKTGINIKYDSPKDLGADRIVNAVAAYDIVKDACITIDFGTATSFGAISKDGDFLGGAICPGMKIASEALTNNTSKLPKIELIVPEKVICKNTITCMQSGLLFGYIGQIEYLVKRFKEELGDATVVATGGLAKLITSHSKVIDMVVPTLTLMGLNRIYEKNK